MPRSSGHGAGFPSVRDFSASRLLEGGATECGGGGPLGATVRCPQRPLSKSPDRLAERAPLLLIVDEFGKSLEPIRDGGDADPYVLQQLAEAGQGGGLPIFIVTLQHLSFDDYLVGVEASQRREWAKVQGRFEDVAYVESARQARALIGSVFDIRDDALRARVRSRARAYADKLRKLGVADGTDAERLASCYPLHPLVVLVLPELCCRYGQHERTLFSFLAGADPASAASFLNARSFPARGPLPSVGLDAVYDYFVGAGAISSRTLSQSSRWTQIATRLRDIHGLSPGQTRIAKSIALLNLVSTSGTIRASREVLALTLPRLEKDLAALEAAGVITYRAFADEYRIWQGTDIDIRRLLSEAHERARQRSLFDILSGMEAPPPVVAARHSAQTHGLRVFSRRYTDGRESVEPLDPFSEYDGEVLLNVGAEVPTLPLPGPGAKPVVMATPENRVQLDRAAREGRGRGVGVGRSGGQGRCRRSRGTPRAARPGAGSVRKCIQRCVPDRRLPLGRCASRNRVEQELNAGRGSVPLSEAADFSYGATPMIRNEMLNRTELTSQGAKARRLLLEAMIQRGSEPDLGFEGLRPGSRHVSRVPEGNRASSPRARERRAGFP